jgi:predicted transcriptional regulator of viral defense system
MRLSFWVEWVKPVIEAPGGMSVNDVAALYGIKKELASKRLGSLRRAGVVGVTHIGPSAIWCDPAKVEELRAKFLIDSKASKTDYFKRREREARHRAAQLLLDQEDMPLNQRIVSASEAPPLRVRAVRSVFELGAM